MHSLLFLTSFLVVMNLAASGPQPGDVYREYRGVMGGNMAWRVTDPNAGHEGAKKFLPNPVLKIRIDDLEGALRAEALLDRWGGHPGTSRKRIRFNGNAWINVPELATTPAGHRPECYMSQDNPTVEIPLNHLRRGENTLEATSGDQVCYSFCWGQWGWNAILIRVYYSKDKPHPEGRILLPKPGRVLGENPRIRAEAVGAGGIERVDFLAWYEGYDENGDGVFTDYHHDYFYNRKDGAPGDPKIRNHVGTATQAPYEVTWDTRWVPDQPSGGMKILARVLGKNGIWLVTDAVENLTLERKESSVKLYKPWDVPERFWVRAGRRHASKVRIPEDEELAAAREAAVLLRTWDGANEKFTLNDWTGDIGGGDHVYTYSVRSIPVKALTKGDNVVGFHSVTPHHGVEILWPGPGLIVRYSKTNASGPMK